MTSVTRTAETGDKTGRPPRAVVGSTIGRDEEMFGAAFDRNVVRRFFSYVKPYRKRLYVALLALLVFTGV